MASSSSYQQNQRFSASSEIEPASKRRVSESSRVYDVFINHRGPDVKASVAAQLYKSLKQLGIDAFLDSEEKELGNSFPSIIETAIRSAKVHIAIFSMTYAKSAWCLNELVLMLESTAKIIPIFYQVKPSDLRYIETGVYAEAFIRYEEKGRYLEKLNAWKEALGSLSLTAGEEFNSFSDGDCQKIVAAVQKEVQRKTCLHVADYPVGLTNLVEGFEKRCLDELVQDFESQCRQEVGKHKAQVVGIFGMGGVGKTTLAKELFNRKGLYYKRSSFLFDVREKSVSGQLPSLQSKLVKDIFGKEIIITSTEKGIAYLKDHLRRNPLLSVLIVVDDIDHVEQLTALGVMDILKASDNSLVIVTTRDVGVLITAGITVGYNLHGLDRNRGRELFCWHAFRHAHPRSGYEALVEDFVDVCGGLPLSLQVLGRHVHGRPHSYWISELIKVTKTLPRDVKQGLLVSFEALDAEKKQIFIDTACFFVGKLKSIAERVWEASGWDAKHALETLKNRCLVEEIEISSLNKRGKIVLRMHDHLRDLGREMANELKHPHRLWRPQDLKCLELKGFRNILAQAEGRCFHSIFDESMGCGVTYFLGEPGDGSYTSLLWLQLEYLGLPQPHLNTDINSIPPWIPLQNLQCLTINNGHFEKLWYRHMQSPLQLRELRISLSSKLQRFPVSIRRLQHLKKIILDFRFPGSSLPDELCGLQSLEILELSCCPVLSSLPPRFGELRKLRYLDLSNCERLEELPDSFNQLVSLEFIRLSCCWKLKLRLDMLKNITMLEYFDLTRCHEAEELPHQITNQTHLTRLFVEGTSIKVLPTNIGELCKLEELRIGSPMLTSLPSSIGNLSCLNTLLIDGCPQLEYFPSSVHLLDLLKQLQIRASGIRELPFGAASSNFEVTGKEASNTVSNLRPSITEHGSLQTHSPNKLHARLEILSLVANPQLLEIRMLPQSLKILEICVCKALRNMSGISGLVNLHSLEICDCPVLDKLPSFADLASLREFKIQGCPKVEIIQGLEHCKSLQILTAEVPLILTCDTISALKPSILSMKGLQKCPWEMMIRGSVNNFVRSIVVHSLSLAGLTVFWLEEDSDWDNITQDLFNAAFLWYEEENEGNDVESGSSVNTSVRKVVHIAVCTEGSSAFSEYCGGRRVGNNPNVKQRKAMVAAGEDESVVEAFHELIELLE